MKLNEALQILDEATVQQTQKYLQNVKNMISQGKVKNGLQVLSQVAPNNPLEVTGDFSTSDIGTIRSMADDLENWISQNKGQIDNQLQANAVRALANIKSGLKNVSGQEKKVQQQQMTRQQLGTAPGTRRTGKETVPRMGVTTGS